MPLVPKRGKSVLASLLEREPVVIPRSRGPPWSRCGRSRSSGGTGSGSPPATVTSAASGTATGRPDTSRSWPAVPASSTSSGSSRVRRARWGSPRGPPSSASRSRGLDAAGRPRRSARRPRRVRVRVREDPLRRRAVPRQCGGDGSSDRARPAARCRAGGVLPAWMLVVGVGGGSILGAQKLAGREADIREIATRHGLDVRDSLPGDDRRGAAGSPRPSRTGAIGPRRARTRSCS